MIHTNELSWSDPFHPTPFTELSWSDPFHTPFTAQQPERVQRMQALLENLIVKGRSTPGPDQTNDVEVRRHLPKPVKDQP